MSKGTFKVSAIKAFKMLTVFLGIESKKDRADKLMNSIYGADFNQVTSALKAQEESVKIVQSAIDAFKQEKNSPARKENEKNMSSKVYFFVLSSSVGKEVEHFLLAKLAMTPFDLAYIKNLIGEVNGLEILVTEQVKNAYNWDDGINMPRIEATIGDIEDGNILRLLARLEQK